MPVGVYPGTFNPLTVAHLAVADAARRQCGLDRVDLVISPHVVATEEGADGGAPAVVASDASALATGDEGHDAGALALDAHTAHVAPEAHTSPH